MTTPAAYSWPSWLEYAEKGLAEFLASEERAAFHADVCAQIPSIGPIALDRIRHQWIIDRAVRLLHALADTSDVARSIRTRLWDTLTAIKQSHEAILLPGNLIPIDWMSIRTAAVAIASLIEAKRNAAGPSAKGDGFISAAAEAAKWMTYTEPVAEQNAIGCTAWALRFARGIPPQQSCRQAADVLLALLQEASGSRQQEADALTAKLRQGIVFERIPPQPGTDHEE